MTLSVDLNSDMGEGFGAWKLTDDAGLLDIVTSANIACGFHAGDADTMAATMGLAVERGVGIGAHPGFPDLQGFGRRQMQVPLETLANMIRYQVGAAEAMARAAGGRVRHLKLHGALSNMACKDAAMARACYEAALDVAPDIIIMGLAARLDLGFVDLQHKHQRPHAQNEDAQSQGDQGAVEGLADGGCDHDGHDRGRCRDDRGGKAGHVAHRLHRDGTEVSDAKARQIEDRGEPDKAHGEQPCGGQGL